MAPLPDSTTYESIYGRISFTFFSRKFSHMKASHFFVKTSRRGLIFLCAAAGILLLISTRSASATPVTTNLVFWVDAADPNNDSITPTVNNTALSTWVNKAPGGQQRGVSSVNQATAGFQPLIKTGVNGLNGLPVVRFDGADDFMQSAGSFSTVLAQPTEIFIVWKADSVGGSASVAYDDGPAGTDRQFMAYETGQLEIGAGNVVGFSTPFSTAVYATAIYNGSSSSLRVNGVVKFAGVNVGSSSLGGVTLGGRFDLVGVDRFSLDGYIAEMLVYSSPLDTTQRDAVEAYLNNKWFVAIPEPGSLSLLAIGILVTLRQRRRTKNS